MAGRVVRRRGLLLLTLVWGSALFAQQSSLSRKITLDLPSCSLETALSEIGKAAGCRFSYDADLIPGDRRVTVKASASAVSTLLEQVLGKEIRPREIGNHIILIRDRSRAREQQPFPDIRITGTVMDASVRMPLAEVTVFETENKRSALTSGDGKYHVVVPTGKKVRSLTFCKSGFSDTVVFLRQEARVRIDVALVPYTMPDRLQPISGVLISGGTDSLGLVRWIVPQETMVNARNLEIRTSRTFQTSVIPYIGTNWRVTGSITNRFSLNLLAGYTGGLKGVEVGGLLNITRNNIRGLQLGGLGNIVGGMGKGWQIGGLFNYDLGKFNGVQVGGLFNYVPDTVSGVQLGGLGSLITGTIKGVQIGGLVNVVTRNCDGWQVSGLLNLTIKDARQVQLTGLVNYADNLDGVQVAGLLNVARRHNSGMQIAGLLNYATYVHGLQLGLINVSGTVERGVPIGLFSYVQEGYHLFEVSGNEIFYGNVAFKSGTRSFYNFVQAGMGSSYKIQMSYGIGTIFSLGKKLSVNLDASAGFVYHPVDTVYHGLLLKFNPALEWRFARHLAAFAGPAYNCFVFSKGKPSATPRGLSTYDFYFESTENASIQMWIGAVAGFRF